MSQEIIQFFKTSRKESIYHTFMHETIICSFMIYVCGQDIVLLNRLLSASYEIADSIRQKDEYVHLRNPCLQHHKENEYDSIVYINYTFQIRSTVRLFINEEDIKDLTFPSVNITLNSCLMWEYTFGNTALQKMAIGNVRNFQNFSFKGNFQF